MPKVISRGEVTVDVSGSGLDKPKYKKVNLRDYDDGFYGHMTIESCKKGVGICGRGDEEEKGECEVEKEEDDD